MCVCVCVWWERGDGNINYFCPLSSAQNISVGLYIWKHTRATNDSGAFNEVLSEMVVKRVQKKWGGGGSSSLVLHDLTNSTVCANTSSSLVSRALLVCQGEMIQNLYSMA